ncbi:MAG: cytochrome d ubiquinol oxidase subunit II [Armatimonadetes bacterium]|nr:cytochrome d ubiquinol oxidase subunit II [Armatimonadota bacterium]
METLWFWIVSVMVAVYVVLDGFDFGAGVLHLFVAKTDDERKSVLAAIGPFWDGNEVWLLAGGGALFFAFPAAYAAGFSGFYLPLTMVLWLLMLRGLSIEFRNKEESGLWRSFWDGTLFVASALMAIVLGAALGNVVRGVPLDQTGYFTGPLFTDFTPGAHPGVLDWFTVVIGVFALVVLAMHGALFLRMKLEGPVAERCTKAAETAWLGVVVVGLLATFATAAVRPDMFDQVVHRPLSLVLAIGFVIALGMVKVGLTQKKPVAPFVASALFIVAMLASTAAAVFPVMLRSTIDPQFSITAMNAHTSSLSMNVGAVVWVIGFALAGGYFVYLFKTFGGKTTADDYGH